MSVDAATVRRIARLARIAVTAHHSDLDQLVRLERPVDLGQHGVGEPIGTDHHHRIEAVSAAPERVTLGRRKLLRHRRIL